MLIHSRLIRAPLAILASAICVAATSLTAQESTTSFDGPPKQLDETHTPEGIGFNQKGGELSSTALEQAAIGNPTIHYHYYGAPAPKGTPAPAGAPEQAGSPAQPQTTTPPGYAPNTYIAPITLSQNNSWHLYTGNIGAGGGGVGGNLGAGGGGGGGTGTTNFHINGGVGDSLGYGKGAAIGDFDPFAFGGAGAVFGFD